MRTREQTMIHVHLLICMKSGGDGVKTEVTGKRCGLPERKWPEVACDGWNSVLTTRFLKVALATSRDSVLVWLNYNQKRKTRVGMPKPLAKASAHE